MAPLIRAGRAALVLAALPFAVLAAAAVAATGAGLLVGLLGWCLVREVARSR